MKQSYYDLLHEAKISWTKTEKPHPDHNPEKALARREELQHLLKARHDEIESDELVVCIEDECHLLWGDTLGYIWGAESTLIPVVLWVMSISWVVRTLPIDLELATI